jgi:hypothetical protein
MDGWINGWRDGWMSSKMNGQMESRMGGWTRRMVRWLEDVRLDRWLVGW